MGDPGVGTRKTAHRGADAGGVAAHDGHGDALPQPGGLSRVAGCAAQFGTKLLYCNGSGFAAGPCRLK